MIKPHEMMLERAGHGLTLVAGTSESGRSLAAVAFARALTVTLPALLYAPELKMNVVSGARVLVTASRQCLREVVDWGWSSSIVLDPGFQFLSDNPQCVTAWVDQGRAVVATGDLRKGAGPLLDVSTELMALADSIIIASVHGDGGACRFDHVKNNRGPTRPSLVVWVSEVGTIESAGEI